MRVYNTLSRQKEEFLSQGDEVKMYVCGVTPYSDCHIGHAMSYVVFDVIRRYLQFHGYKVKYVQNITDIDDKIIDRAGKLGVSTHELAEKYTNSHFPPGEPEYKDISSLVLLKRVRDELTENGWSIDNVDATVVAEQPKLRDFIDRMREQLSQTLSIAPSQVSVKASTSSQLGSIGRGEGIATWAVALLERASV